MDGLSGRLGAPQADELRAAADVAGAAAEVAAVLAAVLAGAGDCAAAVLLAELQAARTEVSRQAMTGNRTAVRRMEVLLGWEPCLATPEHQPLAGRGASVVIT
jgi:hypothetical protein